MKDDDTIDVTNGVGKDLIKALNSPIQTSEMYDKIKLKINNDELTKKEWKKELDKVNEWIDSYVRDFYENSLAELIFLRVQLQLILEYEIDPIVLDVIELIKNHSSFIPKKEELGSNLYQSLMEKLKNSDINTQKTIWMHLTHSKGTLFNDFEEGYEIPFFEGANKGVEQRAQLHILYEIELPAGFDEDEDDVHNLIDWECIIAVKYIEGYLEQTNPDECFILGIDEDDYRNIESDNCYQWNGWGEDDSEVSKAKDVNEAYSIFGNYIAKFAKNKKDKYSPS